MGGGGGVPQGRTRPGGPGFLKVGGGAFHGRRRFFSRSSRSHIRADGNTEVEAARAKGGHYSRARRRPSELTTKDKLEIDMEQAAQIARVTVDGIRALLRRNKVPTQRFGNRRRYVRHADLMALLRSRTVR
jgi:hypothetical protein